MAGTVDEGMFLAFLDLNGNPLNTNTFFFPFPAGAVNITKPIIIEDPNNLGSYFIAGSYNNVMYGMLVDYTGVTSWSNLYAISGQVNAMTLSIGGDPVIVGQTDITNPDIDGFIINLNPITGVYNYFKTFDYGNYFQRFSCISPAVDPNIGYIIGGQCETSTGFMPVYNLSVDAAGTKNWDNVITSNADFTAGNFVGITQRYNSYMQYEYYGVMTSTAGIIVSRMDNNGLPSWNGAPAGPTSKLDEFVYFAPGVSLFAEGIEYVDGPSNTCDLGLHIFGTDLNSTPSGHYLAEAYFSGHNGCTVPGYHFSASSNYCTGTANLLASTGGLTACNAINIKNISVNSKVDYCGPYSSVSNASNQREVGVATKGNELTDKILVFPNPINEKQNLTIHTVQKVNKVVIFDQLGQVVFETEAKDLQGPLCHDSKIEIDALSLENGIYTISIYTNHDITSQKLVWAGKH